MLRSRAKGPLVVLATAMFAVLALVPSPAWAAKTERLLILPLEHELGKDAARMRPVEEAFRDEATALQRFRVLPRSSTATLLESVRSLGLDCQPGDLDCLTKAGVIMEIELLAVLRAASSQERLVVSAVLVDVTTGRTRASVSRTLGPGDSLRAALRSATVELLAPDLYVGALELSIPQRDATVRVDGAVRGTTPLAASIGALAPGEHVVTIEKPGFTTVERIVVVKPLESTSLVVDLEPLGAAEDPSPPAAAPSAPGVAAASSSSARVPMLPVVFGSVAAASAVAAAGTGFGAFLMNERFKDASLPTDDRRDARGPGQMLVLVGATTSVIALVAAAAAGATLGLP